MIHDIGQGAHIDFIGTGVLMGDAVVQGVNTLEDGNLIFTEASSASTRAGSLACFEKLKMRDQDFLAGRQHMKMLVEKIHVEAFGRLAVKSHPSASLGEVSGSTVLK